MLAWLFAAVESNGERAKTMPNYALAAPDGFFMNLAAVCLKLCQPFLEPSAKTWARLDAGCALRPWSLARRTSARVHNGTHIPVLPCESWQHLPLLA